MTQTCLSPHYPRTDYFIGKDLNLYYDLENPQWYKRPDWFLVLGARKSTNLQELRLSYVMWQEEVSPFLVVELASPGTEDEDLGRTERKEETRPTKWEVYEEILKVPYYVVYDRYENEFRGFALRSGEYEELDLEEGRLWLEELGLGLELWQGNYEGVEGRWLRFYDRFGDWVSTPSERADYEAGEKQRQRQRAISAENERDRERSEKVRERRKKERERREKEQEQQRAILAENQRDRQQQRAIVAENQRDRQEQRADRQEQRAIVAENQRDRERLEKEQERQRADRERQEKEQIQSELQQLKAKLQKLDIDPNSLS